MGTASNLSPPASQLSTSIHPAQKRSLQATVLTLFEIPHPGQAAFLLRSTAGVSRRATGVAGAAFRRNGTARGGIAAFRSDRGAATWCGRCAAARSGGGAATRCRRSAASRGHVARHGCGGRTARRSRIHAVAGRGATRGGGRAFAGRRTAWRVAVGAVRAQAGGGRSSCERGRQGQGSGKRPASHSLVFSRDGV